MSEASHNNWVNSPKFSRWVVGLVSNKAILIKCIANVHRYSSAWVLGLCVGTFSSFARLTFACRHGVPCKCAKNRVGSGRQSHASLNLIRVLFRVTYNS